MAVRKRTKAGDFSAGPVEPEVSTVTRPSLLVNGSDAEFRTFIHRSMSFARWISGCRERFGALIGMSGVQFEALMLVSRLQGEQGITVGELSTAMHLSGAFTTIEIGKLVEKGLLAKSADLRDRRRVRLRITPEGRKVLLSLLPYQRRVNDLAFGDLEESELRTLTSLLGKLLPAMDRALVLADFFVKQESGPIDLLAR